MQKLFFLFLFSFSLHSTSGKTLLPTIRATSTTVDIRVGDDYFSKGGWTLEPHKNPDVFSIGSKWSYKSKRVTFITDVDSISFNVQPGRKYDFIILLNQQTPCYIQIVTLATPVFMNAKIVIPILAGFAVLLIFVYLRRNTINTVNLLHLGYVVPLFFWIVVYISGHIHGNYNHLKNVISELGAIESKSEIFTSSSFIFLSVLNTLFSIGFYKASKTLKLSVIPSVLSFSMPVSLVWAAIFPLGNEFHSLTGPLPFLIISGSLYAFLIWKKGNDFLVVRILSLLSFLIMMLILTRFIKPFSHEYEGLIQRFFYVGWTVWILAVTHFISNKLRTKKNML